MLDLEKNTKQLVEKENLMNFIKINMSQKLSLMGKGIQRSQERNSKNNSKDAAQRVVRNSKIRPRDDAIKLTGWVASLQIKKLKL